MANKEQVARLLAGVEGWNEWRRENPWVRPDLRGADLMGAILIEADLSRADLSRADLSGTTLSRADLSRAELRGAILIEADLSQADLSRAILIEADLNRAILSRSFLIGADLSQANLSGTTLSQAILSQANLSGAFLTRSFLDDVKLSEANLQAALLHRTIFADIDLRGVLNLDALNYVGPSIIGIDTLYRSKGQIPEVFLRGCGVPDSMIEYARSLVVAERPIDYYSVFISYSSHDEALAERLHADLQARGVRCWYAPEDLKIGESILGGIDQGIRLHEKLLLLLSESSVQSAWVETEVKLALDRERNERRRVLFPVRIDDAVLTSRAAWAALIRADHHIGDFCQWKEHDSYQAVFARLLRDLKSTPDR